MEECDFNNTTSLPLNQPRMPTSTFSVFIFQDWPDGQCIDILRNLVPALKNGAKFLINDIVLPEPNTFLSHLE